MSPRARAISPKGSTGAEVRSVCNCDVALSVESIELLPVDASSTRYVCGSAARAGAATLVRRIRISAQHGLDCILAAWLFGSAAGLLEPSLTSTIAPSYGVACSHHYGQGWDVPGSLEQLPRTIHRQGPLQVRIRAARKKPLHRE